MYESFQKPRGQRLIVVQDGSLFQSPYAHKFGGVPSNGAQLPICVNCGTPHHLLFQIDLNDPAFDYLGLRDLEFLFFLICLNCPSADLEPIYYRFFENGREIILLHQESSLSTCIDNYPILKEWPVTHRPLGEDDYPLTEEMERALLNRHSKHQVGGLPVWVQNEEQVMCIVCGEKMRFTGMVDCDLDLDVGHYPQLLFFGDTGTAYVFRCHKCNVLATLLQKT